MRELNVVEIGAVSGGSVGGDYIEHGGIYFPILDNGSSGVGSNPFHSQQESYGGVTSNFENAFGGVTTVHIAGASLHASGAFVAPDGQFWDSSGSYIDSVMKEQAHRDQCEAWLGVAAFGTVVGAAGLAATALGGTGGPIALAGGIIASVGVVGAWGSGCF